jgi:uncharacterized membrane protein
VTALIARLLSPPYYLAIIGAMQLISLWALQWRVGLVPLALALIGLLLTLGALLSRRVTDGVKQLTLLGLTGIMSVLPVLVVIVTRPHLGFTFEHDGLMQTESAIDRVLHGQPIYGIDWSQTPIGKFPWDLTAQGNPAVHHYAYYPLTVLSAIPFKLATLVLHVPFDYRMVLLAFLAVGIVATALLPVSPAARMMVAIAVFINPQVTTYFFMGRNDIAFLAMVLLTLALLARGRTVLSSLALGVGIALKPFALLALPFLVLAIWLRWQRGFTRDRRREVVGCGLALTLPAILTIAPFFFADPGAFWRDTVLFTNGGIPDAYPINGQGFSAILYSLRVIAHRTDGFPFGIFQVAAMLPALWLGVRLILRRPTLASWIGAYTLLLFAFAFFSRFFNDNYAGDVIALALCVPALRGMRLIPAQGESSLPRSRRRVGWGPSRAA